MNREEVIRLNDKDHKTLTLKERATLIVASRERIEPELNVKFMLSNKLSKGHALYYMLHFDEYFCVDCNKRFKEIWDISEDWGFPVCCWNNGSCHSVKELPK